MVKIFRRSTMKSIASLLYICFFALLSPLQCGTSSSGADDRRWLVSLVDLVELDYVDHCEKRADASWNELLGQSKGLAMKVIILFINYNTSNFLFVYIINCLCYKVDGYTVSINALCPHSARHKRKLKLYLQGSCGCSNRNIHFHVPRYSVAKIY